MAATKAVQFALGALVGADQLTPAQIQERVAGIQKARLPSRPALDAFWPMLVGTSNGNHTLPAAQRDNPPGCGLGFHIRNVHQRIFDDADTSPRGDS
jgi:hypothetical protein